MKWTNFFDALEASIRHKDEKAAKQVMGALQAFVAAPHSEHKKIQALKKIQASGVSTDFTQLTEKAFTLTVESDNFDLGWQTAFREVPLAEGRLSWQIYNVANGLTFNKIEEGDKIEVQGLSGSLVTANADYYGGAIGWTDKMIRAREIPAMVDLAETFRNKFWANKADNFYALLAAVITANPANVVAYQGAAADGRLQRDILTINQCAFQIGNENKDKGFGDMANAPMVIYANPADNERIEAAFRAITNSLATAGRGGDEVTARRISRIYTYNSNITAGLPLMVLPGQKMQRAEVMAPTTYGPELDILSLNQVQSVWSIYGGVVADSDQVYQFTLA
jgi:hypothetical protein